MSGSWVQRLQARETGARPTVPPLPPLAAIGTLVLDEQLRIDALPGGVLSHLPGGGIHYVDLGGIQASSLLDFGGSDQLWAGVTKLYASRSGFTSLAGIGMLRSIKYLYLDANNLPGEELLRLASELPLGQLHALDLRDNPGLHDGRVLPALLDSGVLARCEYLNGHRIRDAPVLDAPANSRFTMAPPPP